jgi:hypothetical protein
LSGKKRSHHIAGAAADAAAGAGSSTTRTLWVISDGTAGMRFQALALAAGLSAARQSIDAGCDEFIVTPPPVLRHMPRLARWLPPASLLRMLARRCPQLPLSVGFPDLIITCGRRMAGLSMALRRLAGGSGCRTIHIQDPRLPANCFDILIVPRHDPARGPNVITTMASLNRLTTETIEAAAQKLDAKWTALPTPRVAVLLGGDNRRYRISDNMADDMAQRLAAFATASGTSLALIPSRRTPPTVIQRLSQRLGGARIAIATAEDANPYPGILGAADAIVVTSDSVNMASEAALTGKPLLIAAWREETGRIAAFHQAMMMAGHSAPLGHDLPSTSFTPLDEMPDIIARIDQLLGDG